MKTPLIENSKLENTACEREKGPSLWVRNTNMLNMEVAEHHTWKGA
jgi:hypothetical protein